MYVFNKSKSNVEVFVIVNVCVIPENPFVHPVDISPEATFASNSERSKSKINLEYPVGAIMFCVLPKFNCVTGFLPVLT